MQVESVLGIDPSHRGTGLCLISLYEKFVVFDRVLFKDSFRKDFIGLYDRTQEVVSNVEYFVDQYKPDVVIIESPLPVGHFVGGTSFLSGVLITRMLEEYKMLFALPPAFLVKVLNKRKYKHRELVDRAKDIIKEEEFICSVEKFSADEAVAFLLAFKICLRLGYKSRREFVEMEEVVVQRSKKKNRRNNLQRMFGR